MKQILKADAREAFARLFPQAKGNYTLGARLLKDQLWPSTPNSSAVVGTTSYVLSNISSYHG